MLLGSYEMKFDIADLIAVINLKRDTFYSLIREKNQEMHA